MTDEHPHVENPAVHRPRLRDVAILAGVSAKTVSRALSGQDYVSAKTLAKVHEAARVTGFRPNGLARELRLGGVSTAVGLLVGDLSNSFYAQIAAGAERVLREHGMQLISVGTDQNAEHERDAARAMLERRVRALLIVPASDDHTYLQRERDLGTPLVFVDRPPVNVEADSIVLDNQAATAAALESLLAHGHRRIGVIADTESMWTSRERIAAADAVMTASGVCRWARYLRTGAKSAAQARQLAAELLAMRPPPTALLALNNVITVGVLGALHDSAQPCALIGFDDFELADVLGISVVAQDPTTMGRLAAELALSRLDGVGQDVEHIVLSGRLVRRGSGELSPGARWRF